MGNEKSKKPPGPSVTEASQLLAASRQGDEKTLLRILDFEPTRQRATLESAVETQTKRTALHLAALRGHHHCVDRLLAVGASTKAKDSRGQTPLSLAAGRGHAACVESLLAARASPNAVDSDGGSPLHGAVAWRKDGARACAEALVEAGACVNAQDCSGWAPLHWACREGVSDCVDFLIQLGADLHLRSNLDWTPLHEAAREGHAHCLRILLEARACTDCLDCTGSSPLVDAITERRLDCVYLLLKYHASPNGPGVRAASDKRPLHVALRANFYQAVELLFLFGADPGITSPLGEDERQSAYDVVKKCNDVTKAVFWDCCYAYRYKTLPGVKSLKSLSRISLRLICTRVGTNFEDLDLPVAILQYLKYK